MHSPCPNILVVILNVIIHAYFFKTVAVRKRMQVSGINYKPQLCSAWVPWWPSCGHTGFSPPWDASSWPPSPQLGPGAVIDVMSPPTMWFERYITHGQLGDFLHTTPAHPTLQLDWNAHPSCPWTTLKSADQRLSTSWRWCCSVYSPLYVLSELVILERK